MKDALLCATHTLIAALVVETAPIAALTNAFAAGVWFMNWIASFGKEQP